MAATRAILVSLALTFCLVSHIAKAFDEPLPTGWASSDIGTAGIPGNAGYYLTNGEYSIRAAGTNVSAFDDNFYFVYRSWPGDGEIVARMSSVVHGGGGARSGLMVRSSLTTDSLHVYLYLKADGTLGFTRRTEIISAHANISSDLGSSWLKLVRRGSVVSAYVSHDGVGWVHVESASLRDMGHDTYFGVATTSGDLGQLATARLDSLNISHLPLPFTSTDIGNPPMNGDATYAYDSEQYTVLGTGDIAGRSDSFAYVYRKWTGDGRFVLQVNSVDLANGSGGLMIRGWGAGGHAAANAPHVTISLTGAGSIVVTRRTAEGSLSAHLTYGTVASPVWLALERSGAQVDTYVSTNGADWSFVQSAQFSGLNNTVLVGLAVAGPAPTTATFSNIAFEPRDVRVAIDAWLDSRWSGESPLSLIGDLHAAGLDIGDLESLESLLLNGRAEYPNAPQSPGRLTPSPLTIGAQHMNYLYSAEYLLFVPSSYNKATQTPVLLVGHGGNFCRNLAYGRTSAEKLATKWKKFAERFGFLIVAPVTDRGWGQTGYSILFSTLSRVQRDYNIDPNRIYLTGHSMGGNLTWRSGIYLGDRWSAISPMSGGYDYVASGLVENLFNVRGFATWGEKDFPTLDNKGDLFYLYTRVNRRIRDWMESHRFPWQNWEKPGGGHETFPEYFQFIWPFLDTKPRNLYRDEVFARAGPWGAPGGLDAPGLEFDTPDQGECRDSSGSTVTKGANDYWNPQRPIPASTFHWLRLRPEGSGGGDQRVWAVNAGNNIFEITSDHAREVRLYLHPKMVDFNKRVTVVVNGAPVFNRIVRPDMATMLSLAREFDDRGRVFYASIDIDISTDMVPNEPSYEFKVINDPRWLDNVSTQFSQGAQCAISEGIWEGIFGGDGIYSITAEFENRSKEHFYDVFFDVVTLTGDNRLTVINAEAAPPPSFDNIGQTIAVSPILLGANRILDPNESFRQYFRICLSWPQGSLPAPFSFYVNMVGIYLP